MFLTCGWWAKLVPVRPEHFHNRLLCLDRGAVDLELAFVALVATVEGGLTDSVLKSQRADPPPVPVVHQLRQGFDFILASARTFAACQRSLDQLVHQRLDRLRSPDRERWPLNLRRVHLVCRAAQLLRHVRGTSGVHLHRHAAQAVDQLLLGDVAHDEAGGFLAEGVVETVPVDLKLRIGTETVDEATDVTILVIVDLAAGNAPMVFNLRLGGPLRSGPFHRVLQDLRAAGWSWPGHGLTLQTATQAPVQDGVFDLLLVGSCRVSDVETLCLVNKFGPV